MNNTRTDDYNEITYLTNNEVLLPSFILSVDKEPTEKELEVAKDFNIPIYVYYSKDKKKEILVDGDNRRAYDYESNYFDVRCKSETKRR